MLRNLLLSLALCSAAVPLHAAEMNFVPDIPINLPPLPADQPVLASDLAITNTSGSPVYAIQSSFPSKTAIDGLEVLSGGVVLLSVEGNATGDPAVVGGREYLQSEVFQRRGGLYSPYFCMLPAEANVDAVLVTPGGTLVVSFDTSTTIAGMLYLPGDLVEFTRAGAGTACGDWAVAPGPKYFDSQAAGVPASVDLSGASLDPATGQLVVTFDLPVDRTTPGFLFLPGTLVEVDASGPTPALKDTPYWSDPNWPAASRINDFSLLSACVALAAVQPVLAIKAPTVADVTLTWSNVPAATDGYRVCRIDGRGSRGEIRNACAALTVPHRVCDLLAGEVSCTDTGPAPASGQVFYYQIKGLCGGSEGP